MLKSRDDRQTTRQWLDENIRKAGLRATEKQLITMEFIWDFLVEHQEFDYSMGDLRKYAGYHVARTTISDAIWRLECLGFIKQTRLINNLPAFQVSSWHH